MGGVCVMPLEIDRMHAKRDTAYRKIGELNDKVTVVRYDWLYEREHRCIKSKHGSFAQHNAKLNQEKTAEFIFITLLVNSTPLANINQFN